MAIIKITQKRKNIIYGNNQIIFWEHCHEVNEEHSHLLLSLFKFQSPKKGFSNQLLKLKITTVNE